MIEAAFQDDSRLLALTHRVIEESPDLGGDGFGDDDLAQLLRGFGALADDPKPAAPVS